MYIYLQAPAVGASASLPEGDVSLPEGSALSTGIDVPAPAASVGLEGDGGSLGGLDVPSVGEGGVSAEVPSVGGGLSGSMPGVTGDVSMPSGSVDDVDVPSAASADVTCKAPGMPSVEGGISGEVPSADASLEAPSGSAPGVGLSADLPSGGVDASGSLPPSGGGVDVSAPSVSGAVEGVKGAVGDLSADVGAEVDDVEVEGPGVPTGEWKKPKKSLFGRVFGSNKGKLEVGGSGHACAVRRERPRRVSAAAMMRVYVWHRFAGRLTPAAPRLL